jgi:hypothetical protein
LLRREFDVWFDDFRLWEEKFSQFNIDVQKGQGDLFFKLLHFG